MPLYTYEHPETGEQTDVIQKMSDKHEYTDDKGITWNRVYSVPTASIDTKIDDFSKKEFVDKTRDKGMTMGQLWDESNAASERRAKIAGKDPIREKYFKKYSKERQGLKHNKDTSKGNAQSTQF